MAEDDCLRSLESARLMGRRKQCVKMIIGTVLFNTSSRCTNTNQLHGGFAFLLDRLIWNLPTWLSISMPQCPDRSLSQTHSHTLSLVNP